MTKTTEDSCTLAEPVHELAKQAKYHLERYIELTSRIAAGDVGGSGLFKKKGLTREQSCAAMRSRSLTS